MALSNMFVAGHTPIDGVARAFALAAAGTVTIPKGACVKFIHLRNKTANAVTGGIKIGTTAAGTDVVAAAALAANAIVSVVPIAAGAGFVNTAAARVLYVEAVTAFNAATVDVAVEYTELVK